MLCPNERPMTAQMSVQTSAQSPVPEIPDANPGRPTVSTPATLTPVGYLQLENGGLYAATSPEFNTRFGINQVTKLAVASRLQLLALSEPFVHATGRNVRGQRSRRGLCRTPGGPPTGRRTQANPEPQLHPPPLRKP